MEADILVEMKDIAEMSITSAKCTSKSFTYLTVGSIGVLRGVYG